MNSAYRELYGGYPDNRMVSEVGGGVIWDWTPIPLISGSSVTGGERKSPIGDRQTDILPPPPSSGWSDSPPQRPPQPPADPHPLSALSQYGGGRRGGRK